MSEEYRIESRKNWITADAGKPNTEQIKLGCLQRIADATEAMAKNYSDLLWKIKYQAEQIDRLEARVKMLKRTRTALRAVVSRLKNERARSGK